jgi:hypothetical protein
VYLALVWGAVLGAAGLFVGYSGNFFLAANPGSAAPLVGLVVTGPLACAIGLGFGAICGFGGATTRQILAIGIGLTVVVIAGSLALTVPEFVPRAHLVKGSVERCVAAATLVPARTQHWQSEVRRVTSEETVEVPDGWEATVPAMVQLRPAVVVTLRKREAAWIRERKWRNGTTNTRIDRWNVEQGAESVLLDESDCSRAQSKRESQQLFCLCYEESDRFPPSELPEYLGIWVLHPVPANVSGSEPDLLRWVYATCSE